MAKYSKALTNKICELIREDSYTIPEICQQVGIVGSTYHEWKKSKKEFSEAVKEAESFFNRSILSEAKKSLRKKISGFYIDETKITYANKKQKDVNGKEIESPRVKEQVTTKKYYAPDTIAIIFALTNRDPENWKNRQETELKTSGETSLSVSVIDSNTKKEVEKLKTKLGKKQ